MEEMGKWKNGECVSVADCEDGKFYDGAECVGCYPGCEKCTGPSETECESCFVLENDDSFIEYVMPGMCARVDCQTIGFLDKENMACQPCHISCETCTGPESSSCSGCNSELQKVLDQDDSCQICSKIGSGLIFNDESLDCLDICGDGLLYNSTECDDGNTDNGDGCDSNCLVEDEYLCTYAAGSPSVCTKTVGPECHFVSISLEGRALLICETEVIFNRELKKSDFSVWIEGPNGPYAFSYDVSEKAGNFKNIYSAFIYFDFTFESNLNQV